jgi:hypothetical protein
MTPLLRLRKLLGRIRRRFAVDTYDVFVRPVGSDAEFATPPGYTYRWGTAADVERCELEHTELDERERRLGAWRLGVGHKLVLGLHGDAHGKVVFSMWVNPRCVNLPGILKRALTPGQWFIYKAFTSPEHRGRSLYASGVRFVLAEMQRAGLSELVGFAHVKKTVSRKALATLHFKSVGRIVHVDFPGLEHVHVSADLAAAFPRVVPRSGAPEAEPVAAHTA